MFKYALRNSTRTGLLADLKAKGFEFGTHSEEGEFTEHIPDLFEQASIRPVKSGAVYLGKCPKHVQNGVDEESEPVYEKVELNAYHANVVSVSPIEDWDVEVITDIKTPYNKFG